MSFIGSWIRGDSQLMQAAGAGDTALLRQCIKNNESVNHRNSYGQTALHLAVRAGNSECVQLLIDNGCNLDARTDKGNTSLHFAALYRNIQCIQLLVNKGCDIHARSKNGRTLLHSAADDGSTECIQLLYDLGVDINAKDQYGKTAYDIAKRRDKTEAAELLHRLSTRTPITLRSRENEKQGNRAPDSTTKLEERSDQSKQDSSTTETSELLKQQGTSHQIKQLEHESNQPQNRPSNCLTMGLDEQKSTTKVKNNCCTGCKCKICAAKENQLNSLEQEIIELKQTKTEKKELQQQKITALNLNTLQQDTTQLKQKVAELEDRQSRDTQRKNEELRHANTALKQNIDALGKRMKTIEQRERGYSAFPHVITPMAGFDIGNMVGKDYMHPQMEKIFSHKTFLTFKKYADPVLITDHLWSNQIITERQYQEIQSYATDIGKAEYIWLLIKQSRKYLDAVRQASIDTNQNQIAALLECTDRQNGRIEEVPDSMTTHRHDRTMRQHPRATKWKPAGFYEHSHINGWSNLTGFLVSLLVLILVILLGMSVPM